MSRKPSFANLRARTAVHSDPAVLTPIAGGSGVPSRQGRKQIAGFFTPEMSLVLHTLARRQGRSLQALMTEAFDDVLRKYGETPVGG